MKIRSLDDYKMVLTNSAIIINDYNEGDCQTLERQFKIWNMTCHRYDILGMHYDKDHRRLYLPRGLDIFYVKKKLESVLETDLTSTINRNHGFSYISGIRMTVYPRNERQMEAINFILGTGNYKENQTKSQLSVNLTTGVGKTYCAVAAMSFFKVKTVIITAQSGLLTQWKEKILQYTNLKSEDVSFINNAAVEFAMNNTKTKLKSTDAKVYLVTHATLQTYAKEHGWERVGEMFEKLGIGVKIFDEAHQNFENMAMIDFYTNVWKTFYLTATPARSDRDEDKIYKLYMKNVPHIDLFDDEQDPHTKYIAVKYNSCPKPSDIMGCKSTNYGLNHMAYIKYLMRNERFWILFDYVFSIIYNNGGKALFYIGVNDAILKIRDHILFNYPELYNDIGIYTTISKDKQYQKTKKYILTTTKSAGAGEDIPHLKYSVVVAEPFKSEILARQTLGRTRDDNTIYIELVDAGFKQLIKYYNEKKPIFNKYASDVKVKSVDNIGIVNIAEDNRISLANRFKRAIELNTFGPIPAVTFTEKKTKVPAIFYGNPNDNLNLGE